jgi:hypothetical protein
VAGCIVTAINFDVNGDDLEAKLTCLFFGKGIKDLSEVSVPILQSDTLEQIKQKLTGAVVTEAEKCTYNVLASNIMLPLFQKG